MLWTSLEEWLLLLKEEIEDSNGGGTGNSVKIKLKLSPKRTLLQNSHDSLQESIEETEETPLTGSGDLGVDLDVSQDSMCEAVFHSHVSSSNKTHAKKTHARASSGASSESSVSMNDSVESPRSERRRKRSERLSWSCSDNEDVIEAISPRICAVIQAFYICCASHSLQR